MAVGDCEDSGSPVLCATEEIAERELFKARDKLIEEWKKAKVFEEESTKKYLEEKAKEGIHFGFKMREESIYDGMIRALSGNDYKTWNNYPHEQPYIYQTDLIDR